MIKKYALIALAALCALSAQAITWKYDNYDKSKKTCRFAGWGGSQPTSGKLSIKETTEKDGVTYKVTAIKAGALNGLDKVTELTIPANVSYIEPLAGFHTMASLTSINVNKNNIIYGIEKGLLASEYRAICLPQKSTVKTVSFTEVKDIDPYAFFNCTSLQTINLASSQDYTFTIGNYAFAKSGLTSITLPKSYDPGDEVGIFERCKKLAKIRCEVTDITVGKAFARNCPNLTEVTFTNTPKEIRQAAFKNCPSLKDFKLNAEVTMREDSIFYNTGFTTVTFTGKAGGSGRRLGAAMFSACRNLESIDLSRVVTANNNSLNLTSCFVDRCPKLKTVEFPDYVETSYSDDPEKAGFTFGLDTPIQKIVMTNLKNNNNYLVNYNAGTRQPEVYLTAYGRDFDFAWDDFCDMKWFFKASDGASIDASIYCADIAPMMTGVCPYATYYIPWGHPGNYADVVAAGNKVYEMFTWTIGREEGQTVVRYRPEFKWASCPEVIFNDTQRCATTDNVAKTVVDLDVLKTVSIITRVNGVNLKTKYPKAYFPETSGIDGIGSESQEGPAKVYDLNGVLMMETDSAMPDLSPLPAGIYIVKTVDDTRKVTR